MISNKKVLESAKVIVDFCKEQHGCQNCIFSKYRPDCWDCHIQALEIEYILHNIEVKKKNRGYIC